MAPEGNIMITRTLTWLTHEGPSEDCPHAAPLCPACGRQAADIPDVVMFGKENGLSPEEFVRQEDGTYNPASEHFLCDTCFIVYEAHKGSRLVGENGKRWVCP